MPRLVEGLTKAYGNDATIIALSADHLVEDAPKIPGLKWIGVRQRDVTDLWSEDSLAGRLHRFKTQTFGSAAEQQAQRIAALLPGFSPDCIIALSDGQFLNLVYPDAAILQHEFGIFSRPPFPESFFFDPVGPAGVAWLGRHWQEVVDRWEPTAEQLQVTRDFIEAYRSAVTVANPFESQVQEALGRFERFALLPLQMTGHALYDSFTPVRSPLQLTLATLEALPEDMGLFVTMHPGGRTLDEGALSYLKSHYPAFLTPQSGWHPAPSQYLVPVCEAVVCVSSTVAALTLFWGNAFIAAGDNYLDFLAASHWTDEWRALSALDASQRERLLAWLLFKFLVVDEEIRDGTWVRAAIDGALRQKGIGDYSGFYNSLPQRSSDIIKKRWINTILVEYENIKFQQLLEKYSSIINSGGDFEWEYLEIELDFLVKSMPTSADTASFHFHKGIRAILWKVETEVAAASFITARDQYAALFESNPDDAFRDRYWDSAFHASYALRYSDDKPALERALIQLIHPPSTGIGPMPQNIAQRIPELAS